MEIREIIGNTTATPNPRPDWNQTDPSKADYIKNKPQLVTPADVTSLQANIDKKIPYNTAVAAVHTVPFIPANKSNTVSYIGLTDAAENNRIVLRTNDGNIKTKPEVSTDQDYAIGAKQVFGMLSGINKILGQSVPAKGTLTTITKETCGFFVIVGASRVEYDMVVNGEVTHQSVESEYHLILKYYEVSSKVYRMIHMYFRAPSLTDFTVIQRIDGAIGSSLTVTNLQSSGGARVIEMPMQSEQ